MVVEFEGVDVFKACYFKSIDIGHEIISVFFVSSHLLRKGSTPQSSDISPSSS